MTYQEFIQNIINTRGQWNIPEDQYYEVHHIVPRCMGGKPKSYNRRKTKHENLIWLYPEEHFIAHKLLAEENPTNEKIIYAWWCMWSSINDCRYEPTKEEYAEARRLMHEAGCSDERRLKISKAKKGYHHTEEAKQKMRKNHYDVSGEHNPRYHAKVSDETRKKIGDKSKLRVGEKNGFYGKRHTDITKAKISKAKKGVKLSESQKEKLSMKILCVETGIVYSSQVEASIATGFGRPAIRKSIKTGCAVGHSRYSKEKDKVHFIEIKKN